MELTNDTLEILTATATHIRDNFEIPEETHIFLALMQEADNPLDIMQSCPPQFLNCASMGKTMTEKLAAANQFNFMLRASCCPTPPDSYQTGIVSAGAIAKGDGVYFPVNADCVKEQIDLRPLRLRKAEIQERLADGFRNACLQAGHNGIAKIHNSVLRPILYRAFYNTLPKMDGIMAGRYVFSPYLSLTKEELKAVLDITKKWENIFGDLTADHRAVINNLFKNRMGNLEVALYSAATELSKGLDN